MRLWGIFRFELAYQARRGWPWLFLAVLLVLSFLMARDAALADALYEDFHANSPFAIASTTVFGTLIWLLVAPAVAGEAAARDVATRMYPLAYTAGVREVDYLGGRFLAALALNALLLLGVQLGMMLAFYSPGIDPAVIGPFRPAAYLTAYAIVALPNAVVATALQFAVAVRTGRAMTSYAGSLLLVFMGFFVASLLLYGRGLGTLLDPIGIRFLVEDLAHSWTTVERDTRLLGLEGAVLANRLLWLGVALATIAATHLRFRFAHRVVRDRPWRRTRRTDAHSPTPAGLCVAASAPVVVPDVPRRFGVGIAARKTLAIAWTSFRTIATSWAGLSTFVAIPLLTVPVVVDQMVSGGVSVVPTTAHVLRELTSPISAELSRWVIVPLLIVFFAGELVWREREARMGEITDATPGSEWVPLLGKLLGLALVLVVFLLLLGAAGILAQTIRGHRDHEVGLYLTVLLGLQLPEYLLFAVLAVAVHVLADQKYVGHLVSVMAYVFVAVLAGMLGIEHNLLVYGAAPRWAYTEMRGFGATLGPWRWFTLYWGAWALLLATAARLLWTRGRAGGFRARLALARRRLTGPTAWVAGAAAALVLALGGFVFYNTNVLNRYVDASDVAERRAEYERRYGRYASIAQPQLTAARLRVDIHPARRAVDVRGTYRLVNGTAQPIDSIHVATAVGSVETRAVTFDRAATLATDDARHGYRIYALARPLAPGDTLRLDFAVHVAPRGFGNHGVDPSLAAAGGAFTNASWFPFVGYQRHRELVTARERREHGLPARPVIASLYDAEAREPAARGGGIAFEAVVGTDVGQVAVAPGALRRTWTEGGRRYFEYATDAPIGREWSFFSAPYAVREARWRDVVVRILHHPAHTAHLDRTMQGVQASLDYYGAQFGAYPYRHLTVVEHPGAPGTGLHADASMISHGEGFPRWLPRADEGGVDFPYAVMAHEMAHQWTLPYAMVEGAPFLSEGLAWYAAMQAVRASRGEAELRRLLATMREPHPYRPIRRGEPLLRALDPYLSYRRGPFAMYALSEYLGADRVNGAIRRLIATHDAPGAPRATTLDLYRELQAVTPDSLRYLLRDLFEVNTYWELATERATTRRTPNGAWEVTLAVRARKVVYDSAGVERDVPMDDLVDVGVFAVPEAGREIAAPLYLRKHRVRAGAQTITVTVPRRPARAGIDPSHLLIDPEAGDNTREITVPR
jgi:ABC-type transport system involved in multi-copper enzyme maturation permease subunit